MVFENATIAFIGAGSMGGAIIGGMLNKGLVKPEQIIASDPNAARGDELNAQYGIQTTTDNAEAVENATTVVLAVKPQMVDRVLPELRGRVDNVLLIVSIMAGVKIREITGDLHNSRVVRAIPNTPAQIGQGISVWTATHEVLDPQREEARALLGALGEQIYVHDERYLDMATGLAGSGPAYVFLFIEAMIDAGVRMGFSRPDAEKLVMQTVKGAVLYAEQSGEHITLLRNQVTSPGGTTAAGLHVFEKRGFRTAVADGVWAAYQRSVELGEMDD